MLEYSGVLVCSLALPPEGTFCSTVSIHHSVCATVSACMLDTTHSAALTFARLSRVGRRLAGHGRRAPAAGGPWLIGDSSMWGRRRCRPAELCDGFDPLHRINRQVWDRMRGHEACTKADESPTYTHRWEHLPRIAGYGGIQHEFAPSSGRGRAGRAPVVSRPPWTPFIRAPAPARRFLLCPCCFSAYQSSALLSRPNALDWTHHGSEPEQHSAARPSAADAQQAM